MNNFLSCDWGTTAFRLRLIDTATNKIIAEESTKQGIAETYRQWQQTGKDESEKLFFYLDIIKEHIKILVKKADRTLTNVPLIISGMASSTIGMIGIPYKNIPFSVDGSDINIHTIEATVDFAHNVTIISGVRTDDDVMRGEETKLIGCADYESKGEHIIILPGTHPKHVIVKDGKAVAFKTYMTGELFQLLSEKSILSVSVERGEGLQIEDNLQSFKKGVREAVVSNILHSFFLVRTNEIFDKLSLQENYYYLSGILIGTEMKDLADKTNTCMTVVGNEVLTPYYVAAFDVLGLQKNGNEIKTEPGDKALIKGQLKIYNASVKQKRENS